MRMFEPEWGSQGRKLSNILGADGLWRYGVVALWRCVKVNQFFRKRIVGLLQPLWRCVILYVPVKPKEVDNLLPLRGVEAGLFF